MSVIRLAVNSPGGFSSSNVFCLAALVLAAAVIGFFMWDYYGDWRRKRHYELVHSASRCSSPALEGPRAPSRAPLFRQAQPPATEAHAKVVTLSDPNPPPHFAAQ